MRKVIALIVLGLAATHEPQADKRKGSYLRGGAGKVDEPKQMLRAAVGRRLDFGSFREGTIPDPTASSTAGPTAGPTAEPTADSTELPTALPTTKPTAGPTSEPTQTPTAAPTPKPTSEPSAGPTAEPTAEPTSGPTADPTPTPTAAPTTTMAPTPPMVWLTEVSDPPGAASERFLEIFRLDVDAEFNQGYGLVVTKSMSKDAGTADMTAEQVGFRLTPDMFLPQDHFFTACADNAAFESAYPSGRCNLELPWFFESDEFDGDERIAIQRPFAMGGAFLDKFGGFPNADALSHSFATWAEANAFAAAGTGPDSPDGTSEAVAGEAFALAAAPEHGSATALAAAAAGSVDMTPQTAMDIAASASASAAETATVPSWAVSNQVETHGASGSPGASAMSEVSDENESVSIGLHDTNVSAVSAGSALGWAGKVTGSDDSTINSMAHGGSSTSTQAEKEGVNDTAATASVWSAAGSAFNETRGFQQTDFFFGDGTGTAHDFENGRAVRLCSSMAPSADWDASAWTVTSNAPGMSSDDFTPGRWCGYVAQGLT